MKTVTLEDFSGKIHSSLNGKRMPLDVSLELTYRCNNGCVHCFCNLPSHDPKALQNELKTAEIKGILDELSGMGTLWLLLTGGEPLLRQDFEEIYIYAKKKGFVITIFTNGTLIDKEIVNTFKHYPPFAVEVTLYGATKETYEKVTRSAGSYQKCIEGIRHLLGAELNVKLKTMAITSNRHEIGAMDRMAEEFGCEFRFDPMIQKRIDCNNYSHPERYRLSPEEVVGLDLQFPYRMAAFKDFCNKFMGKPSKTEYLYQCGAGRASMHINPYGIAMGCMMMIGDGFSIKEHRLNWIWEEGIKSVITRKKDFTLPCDDCSLINLCGQCPGWSIGEHGDVRKELQFLCETAKKRSGELHINNL
jgi:radical SAM protein with 4Fe4S-binding SPASM domain